MSNDIDLKIKKFLEENDDIIVPKEVSNGIGDTLKSINETSSKKFKFRKRLAIASTLGILILTVPFIAKASIEKLYKYIPGNGNFIESEGKIYILKEATTKQKGNADITLSSVTFNEEKQEIEVKVEGEFEEPNKFAKINIDGVSKLGEGYLTAGSSDSIRPDKWIYNYKFKYKNAYSDDKINIKISWNDGRSVNYDVKLQEAKAKSDYRDLGITDVKLGIGITGFIQENKNELDINLVNNIRPTNEGLQYGIIGYPVDEWELNRAEDGVITLTDAKGKVVKGKMIQHEDRNNHFRFDTSGLVKPFNINIPSINIATRGEVAISDEIELSIEEDGIETTINKDVEMKFINDLYKDGNNKVKITKGRREGDKYTLELEYINNKDNPIKIDWVSVKPSGESIKKNEWFESGLSGIYIDENISELSFELPYPDQDKLYIKLEDSQYKIDGNWNLVFE